jgi:hypothetical protein
MNSRLFSRLSFIRAALLVNGTYWFVFAILFAINSYPYAPHPMGFEEITPSHIFFGRALRPLNTGTGIGVDPRWVKITYLIQWPSARIARLFYWHFNQHEVAVDTQYWGISLGGYYLIIVCLLSFLQWYLVGMLFDYARKRCVETRARAKKTTH